MNREQYLKSIADSLGFLRYQVSVRNAVNLYDINIAAESFYAGLINLIEDWNLKNANVIDRNAPGIDLVDDIHRISIQVTADITSEKIRHTIDEFIKNRSYEKYDRLIIFILTEKKKYNVIFDTQGKFSFNKDSDIWDIKKLIQTMNSLDTDRLREINDYLQTELNTKCFTRRTEANEVETIIDLIEYITGNRQIRYQKRDRIIDPEYKIYKRFREFANRLISQYTDLFSVYGPALAEIETIRGSDDAQNLIIMLYLQELSMKYLDESQDNPVAALDKLVSFFEEKLGNNGRNYDRMAIRFYLINEMIKCNVFPNEGGEYYGS